MQTNRGVTLVELIICLAIVSIILSATASSFSSIRESGRGTAALNWILGSVVYARQAAIVRNQMVTLCPGPKSNGCGGKWHDQLIVFTDANGNRKIDGADEILEIFRYPAPGSTLKWRAFQNKQYLQMTAEGFTNYQNGNFVYCPASGDVRQAKQLVINIQGRARVSSDIDGDGIVEDAKGKDLKC